jgi:putative hydrolase of the HAD superfamily
MFGAIMIYKRAGRRTVHRLWWLLAGLALSACQADFAVEVTVEEDGSGLVETTTVLDAEAASSLLDLSLASDGLPLNDLAQSGWVTTPPEIDGNGDTIITASKAFGNAEQFADVMAELTGDTGIFRDFELQRDKTFARVDYAVAGTLDATDGLAAFGDPTLTSSLGRSLESIAEQYGASEDSVNIQLEVVMPGEVQEFASTGAVLGEEGQLRARWRISLADGDVTEVAMSSATRQVSALVLRGVAIVAGVLAAIVAFAQLLRIVRPDRQRGVARPRADGRRSQPGPPPSSPDPAAVGAGASNGGERHRVVALDGMGVLYREGDEVANVLIPFARERGSEVSDEEIGAKARLVSLGRITTSEFWSAIGVEGDPGELDSTYVSRHQLSPGVIKYLRSLRDRGVRVACVTNDGPEWAAKLKVGHSLDKLIDPWVISGSVGVRKPDKPIFEVLRRMTAEPASSILVVDDNLDILDAARDLGFATAWFSAEGTRSEARNHTIFRSFDVDVDVDEDASQAAPAEID